MPNKGKKYKKVVCPHCKREWSQKRGVKHDKTHCPYDDCGKPLSLKAQEEVK